jgi:hypothetical protein
MTVSFIEMLPADVSFTTLFSNSLLSVKRYKHSGLLLAFTKSIASLIDSVWIPENKLSKTAAHTNA